MDDKQLQRDLEALLQRLQAARRDEGAPLALERVALELQALVLRLRRARGWDDPPRGKELLH